MPEDEYSFGICFYLIMNLKACKIETNSANSDFNSRFKIKTDKY